MPATQSPQTILMVEDNALQRRQLEAQLQPLGHRLLSAVNGQEALDRMKENPPDLVIMDVVMPSMDGFKACEAIKADPRTAGIPVIVLTADGHAAEKAESLGAAGFLQKPTSATQLLDTVERYCA